MQSLVEIASQRLWSRSALKWLIQAAYTAGQGLGQIERAPVYPKIHVSMQEVLIGLITKSQGRH